MTNIEELAIAQAVYKVVADVVSTKNPGSLRSRADKDLRDMYDQVGVKSIDIKLDGQKVGTYSVAMSKATTEKHEKTLEVRSPRQVMEWIKDNPEEWDEFVSMSLNSFAEYVFEEYGEVPDGCEVVDHVTPAQPERIKNTILRVEPQKVAEAMQGQLPAYVAGLLEGGED